MRFDAMRGVYAYDPDTLPEAQSWQAEDGCWLGFRHYACKSRRLMIMIHGSGCHGDQMAVMAKRLSQEGAAQVITLDMRGHGLSGGERGFATDYADQCRDDVTGFVAFVARRWPGCDLVLAGHSAGGGLVLSVAEGAADPHIRAYVLLAPFLGLGSRTVRPCFGGWVHPEWLRFPVALAKRLLGFSSQGRVLRFAVDAGFNEPRLVRHWSLDTVLSFGPGLWNRRRPGIAYGKPVLLLAGREDDCFETAHYPRDMAWIAPQADIPDIGKSGHWRLLVEDRAYALLTTWLDRHVENGDVRRMALVSDKVA